MVNPGRVACLSLPFVLTVASLTCLVLVFLAGTAQHNSTLDGLYFFKVRTVAFPRIRVKLIDIPLQADTTNFSATSTSDVLSSINGLDGNLTGSMSGLLEEAKKDLNLKDYYTVYLWNYCAWNGDDAYSFCSPKQAKFWFDPIEVWGLNGTGVQNLFPQSLKDGLQTYKVAAGWAFVLYVLALVFTIIELFVSITAIFSRWGSFATTIFSTVSTAPLVRIVLTRFPKASTLSIIGASATATALYAILDGAFNTALRQYGIHGSIGASMLRLTWLAALFSLGGALFWLFSICCCTARSPYGHRNRTGVGRVRAEKTPYTYERVGSPYLGPQQNRISHVPLMHVTPPGHGVYEPFRPQQV